MMCHAHADLVVPIFSGVHGQRWAHETHLSIEKATPMLGDQPLYR
jgi:hypothetical protein